MPGNIFEDNLFKRQGGFSATPVLNDIVSFASQHSARTKTPLSTEALQALSEGAIGGLAEKQSQDAYRQGALSLEQQRLQNQQDQFNKEVQLREAAMNQQRRQFKSAQEAAFFGNITGALTVGGIALLGQNWKAANPTPFVRNIKSLSAPVSNLARQAGGWIKKLFT